jgi:hypothetical protein
MMVWRSADETEEEPGDSGPSGGGSAALDVETCLRPVLKALRQSDLPAAKLHAWCSAMIKSDRVGFICDQELQALRRRFKKSRSR